MSKARKTFENLQKIDPNKIHCMIGMVVVNTDDEEKMDAHAFMIGSKQDVINMLSILVSTADNAFNSDSVSENATIQ